MGSGSHENLSNLILKNKMICFIASSSSNSDLSIYDYKEVEKILKKYSGHCLVLGNESRGTNENLYSLPKKNIITVHIPIQNVESLNVSVAGSILMSHFMKLQ